MKPQPYDSARVIQVVETNLTRHGDGSEENPWRVVRQYWTFDGELLAEVDAWADERRFLQAASDTIRKATDARTGKAE